MTYPTTSGAGGTAASAAPAPSFPGMPSYGSLIGVWAGAVNQMLDISARWWREIVVEQGAVEDQTLRQLATTVLFNQRAAEVTLTWSATTLAGLPMDAGLFHVTPRTVPAGSATVELTILLSRPEPFETYFLTLSDVTGAKADDPRYCVTLGVIAS